MSSRRPRAVRWKWPLVVVVLLFIGVTIVVLAFPAVAATTCPGCYDMRQLQPGVYAEPDLSAEQRHEVIEAIETGRRRVGDFYGGRESSPQILACMTEACYHRIGGGGERGIGVLNRAVMLSPRGVNPVIAAHEMSHVEFRQRLGSARDRVPQWFDEGLAVLVSDDPRYLAPKGTADRCLLSSEEGLPVTLADWLHAASADERLYAHAACRVSRWVDANGGPRAVSILIDHLTADADFAAMVNK